MNFGGGQGHCAAHVVNLNPGALEITRPLKFRDYAVRALLNHLRNKLVGIEQLAANSDEQTARPGLSRIVRNVGHDCGFVAKQLTVNRLRDFSERYTLSLHDDRR